MSLCMIFTYLTIAFIIFYIFVLPMVSTTTRYYVKMSLYYFLLLVYGLIVTVCAIFRPKQLANYKYPMTLVKLTRHILGIRYEVEQIEKLNNQGGSYVVISNHQSSIDLVGVGLIWPYDCTIVSKKSLMYAGWFGFAAWLCGCIFISRGRQSARDEMQRLARRMASGESDLRVWIFPEGTRHAGPDLGEFKKGSFHLAVQAQVPIVPIVFSNYDTFFSSEGHRFDNGNVKIRVLDAVSTAGKTAEDIDQLMGDIRDQMNQAYHEISDDKKSH